jgi:peptidylprolyl isomerase
MMLICAAAGLTGCGGSDSSGSASASSAEASAQTAADRPKPEVTPPEGPAPETLVKEDLIEGTGAEAKAGDEVAVRYVGVGYESGTEFDSSWALKPFRFKLGAGKVIRGWDEGVAGMRVGGRRELIIPPDYAYGSVGTEEIAPDATLVFVIDLLSVE